MYIDIFNTYNLCLPFSTELDTASFSVSHTPTCEVSNKIDQGQTMKIVLPFDSTGNLISGNQNLPRHTKFSCQTAPLLSRPRVGLPQIW